MCGLLVAAESGRSAPPAALSAATASGRSLASLTQRHQVVLRGAEHGASGGGRAAAAVTASNTSPTSSNRVRV